MITDFRAWLNNMHDTTHHRTIYSGIWEFIQHKSRNKTYILDEQLQALELCISHGIKVQVEGLKGQCISQMCWCTGSQSWRRGDQWIDRVWVRLRPGRWYGVLNGRLPWQLQWLFPMKSQNEDGAFIDYWLTRALTTIPENLGNLDPVSKFEKLRNTPAAYALQVFNVGNLIGCMHVIPEIATSWETGNKRNERCIGNSDINLATWNDVYI